MKSLSETDWLNIDRELASRSLAEYAKMAWHVLEPSTDMKWGWCLDAICEHLEAVTSGEIKRLLINVPPGTMKSLMTNVIWPSWEWGPKDMQSMRFMSTAHSKDLAIRDNLKCRRLIESQWFTGRWSVQLTSDQNAKTKFENDKTGFREAMSFTGITGSRGDRFIIDDPLKVNDANSLAELEDCRLNFTEAVPSRVNNDDSAIIVIMQRIHQLDPSGIIKDLGLDYDHLCIPMRHESDLNCRTSIGWTDPRTVDGELMFEERFSEKFVTDLEKSLGPYGTAGQLQQRPTPRGGGMFKRDWFNVLPAEPPVTKSVRAWDFAATKNVNSAFTCGLRMGVTDDGRYIIGDVNRFKGTPAEVERTLVNVASQDGKNVRGSIPKDPGQAGVMQANYFIKALAGYPYRASPETGDKETRAEPLAAQAEIGNVYLVKGDWNESFLSELENFPVGKFKDQVDAASRAFGELTKKVPASMMLLRKKA